MAKIGPVGSMINRLQHPHPLGTPSVLPIVPAWTEDYVSVAPYNLGGLIDCCLYRDAGGFGTTYENSE